MRELFSSEFFRSNRDKLRQLFTGTAPIVVTANAQVQKSGDEPYPFHQDRSFWYLTGIDEPGVILVMDKGKEYIIVPGREHIREQFDGTIDFDDLARRSGISSIVEEKEGRRQLEARVKRVKHIATLAAPPKFIDFWGMYTNPARADLIRRLRTINPELELLDIREHLSRMRMVKQTAELTAIRQAIDIAIDSLKETVRPARLSKYAYEYEIEADITRGFRRRGATGHSFTPVVAGGRRACTIHHIANDGELAADELLMLDIGAEVDHYMSDIARTYSLNGRPSRRQQAVYDAVFEAQEYAFSLLKPGVQLKTYEILVEEFVGEKLRELGLIKTIDRESVREFFPHKTSHFIGLEAHDAGDYDRVLEPGIVLAVEPGIYIPDEAIGVRLEDDIVVTETGITVLSARLPRSLC